MKRILITGMNKLQTTRDFYLNQQLKVVPSHYSLVRCLEDMGFAVDQRPVEIGEDLEKYYKVIVFLHNPSGFAGYVYNALWTISTRPDCILAFDDWQTDSIYNGLTELKDSEKMFRKFVKDSHKLIPDNIEKYRFDLANGIVTIKAKRNNMLISAFANGDPSLLLDYPKEKLFTYNPNPYHLNRQPQNTLMSTKEKVFNFAGLVQDKTKKWLKEQKIDETGWELKLYGSRKDKQDRVTEDQMVTLYSQHWGILMAGYFHAGSGWWRARPLQVADAGSILIGDPEEMIIYYNNSELANVKAMDLVDASDKQLEELAAAQKEAIYNTHPLDKQVQQEEINKCLTS